jgi:hypothetical protein
LDIDSAYFCPPEDKQAWTTMLEYVLNDPYAGDKAKLAQERSQNYTILAREQSILKGLGSP